MRASSLMQRMKKLRNGQFVPVRGDVRAGFSMVEMMVVIGIIGILATVAAPPVFRYVQSNRLQTSADRMAADLQYARALSISNGQILRFSATPAGYQLTNPNSGVIIRENAFAHGMAMAATQTADFYPWGMAETKVFNLTNAAGTRQINLLPTGIVEVD